ncbi:MFS transporter [Streptomyces alfalfae]|uniref:MFS transporter n=1 Tax=Streptomyces alfalfae TaxID=1642299 RepID=A0ABN4VW58_9ACTN|nr:MFS transporter [Streptomyces alfalfae]AYA19967.1 MFS transporter [Streptomyces fradiae]APY89525.1 MFS transporter [Streptomyces alfalfae]QUI30435.1 MFS transporter [Streptomyces alfalfae]RXX44176.1 MFS transporter [Streptomyces alfalfae]RZN02162.1 MFS transporter [Streptomyces alfalfae]
MPRAVYVLALGIFTMVTSEFVVAGLMPQMADGLDATIPEIGYLITAFAAAMALGGPFLTVALLRMRQKSALMLLFGVFLAGNVLAALAPDYRTMLVARVLTGIASQAFFGVSLSLVFRVTGPAVRGRAVAVALNGLMLGTLLGLPISTVIGEHLGWRAAFWAITALTVLAALATLTGVPAVEGDADENGGLRRELGAFRSPRLWFTLTTSTFVIGATFSAFSYLNPILTGITGFSTGAVPLLLIGYGAATVVGNTVVGRFADRRTLPVLLIGLALNLAFLVGFALFAHLPVAAVPLMTGIGLVGVTMNPALVTRVQRVGNARPLVNTVHSSFITLGIIIATSVGGPAIDTFGLRAPLWVGAGLALLGLGTLLPDVLRRGAEGGTAEPETVPAAGRKTAPDLAGAA